MTYEELTARRNEVIAREAGKPGLRGKINAKCSCEGCNSKVRLNGLCNAHYLRLKRYGRLHKIRRDKGSGTVKNNGYVQIGINGRMVYEHRLIAEQALGRKLKDQEEVHHIDGNPSNNSHDNLVICPDRAYHVLLHKLQKEKQ